MSTDGRRKFIASGLALSCGPYVGSAQANSSLPAIVSYLLDGPNYYSGVATSTSSPSETIPFCLTQTDNNFIVQAVVYGRVFFEGQSTQGSPNAITMLPPASNNLQLEMIVTSTANGVAAGTYRLSVLPGDNQLDTGTFSVPQSSASCEFEAPTAVFSNCLITLAEDDGAQTEIAFAFKLTTTPAELLAENFSTVDFELTFQPSGDVMPGSGTTSIDANGNGVSAFISPFSIVGEASVTLTLNDLDGLDPSQVTSCSAPSVNITAAID